MQVKLGNEIYRLTGVQAPCKEKQAAFRYRNEVFGRAIPLSALSALIVIVINYCRRNNVMTWLFGSNIAHPYAAQVYGIIMGYLVVNRLNISLARWNNGAQTAAMMGSKWSEAQAILAAFLHSEAENADAAKKRELIEAEKEAMHLFSLLHAIALTNLSQTTGQVIAISWCIQFGS